MSVHVENLVLMGVSDSFRSDPTMTELKRRSSGNRRRKTLLPSETQALPPGASEIPWNKHELAVALNVSNSAVDKMVAAKRAPPSFKFGKLRRWWPSAVRKWTEAGGSPPNRTSK